MITFLIILYIGLSIMNGIAILKNNPEDIDAKDLDRSKGFLKPYTLTILSSLIVTLCFMKLKILMGLLFMINVILDIKRKA
jgi:hypothetical protein